MMLGKRSRPPFRRTTSMTGINVDMGSMAEAPTPPAATTQRVMIGDEMGMLSPRYTRKSSSSSSQQRFVETADFLRSCGLCNRRLSPGRDIYMYRGDTAFCSLECREQQMKQDERNERRASSTNGKNGESHRLELAATAVKSSGNSGTVAAA